MIPFVNLKSQYQSIKTELDAALLRVAGSGQYTLGPEVDAFETEFAEHCGAAHSVAVNSGTSALHLALLAAGVGPGDEVITSPFTFVASVAAILYAGARPVFADIDPHTCTISPEEIKRRITPRTKAIIPVHLYGRIADMTAINAIAERNGIIVIEDAAQAHGAEFEGKHAGSLGHFACFSFYPTKNLGALGEGGMVTTGNSRMADRLRELRDWGQKEKGTHAVKGYNYRMDAIQAAVLRVKLPHLREWNDARRKRAALYDEMLADSHVTPPPASPGRRHVYHLYVVRTRDRDDLRRSLQSQGIETAIHYAAPVHLQPAYTDLGYSAGDFPEAERAAREVVSLPMYPALPLDDVRAVSAAVIASA